MIIPCYYEDPHSLHVGTMPNRAYYIPASRRSDTLVEHRETSDRFQLLNGSWKFRYYASIYDLQDAFYAVGYDASAFDTIRCPAYGRTTATTTTSTPTSAIRSPLIRRMFPKRTPAALTSTTSPTKRMPLPRAHF